MGSPSSTPRLPPCRTEPPMNDDAIHYVKRLRDSDIHVHLVVEPGRFALPCAGDREGPVVGVPSAVSIRPRIGAVSGCRRWGSERRRVVVGVVR